MKIGRNEPCPCGSGIKYKKCHLNRESQRAITKGEVIGMVNSHKISKKCFHPMAEKNTCQGKIIQSHTISKSSSLKKLSKNSKVLHFKTSNSFFENEGDLSVEEIGVNKASTFPGFCEKHDKEMFSPIEDKNFDSNEYHSFLLGFRALTKEIYTKESAIDMIPKMRSLDKGYSISKQVFLQDMLHAYQQGSELGIRDLRFQKIIYDDAFKSNDFSYSNYYIIKFRNPSNLLFSGAIYPEYDFKGNFLQQLDTENQLNHISVNAINTPSGGCVIFQWLGVSEVNLKLVGSLHQLDNEIKASAVTQFAFESFENLYMKPDWWGSLGALQKSLNSRVLCGASFRNHESSCFKPDGKNYYQWQNIEIETNIKI
jgi:hypothetical protein